ncbi:MAG TPA: hypothetical protein VMW75_10695, partial [Thermoanaerobaculia bacterium]|nr:hypothetical protein [Thermoanaerobaculia bacterium]
RETALLTCDEVAAKVQAAGARLLLAGTINTLTLNASLFQSTVGQDNRFQVEPHQFDVELGRVTSGEQRIGGGSMKLAGARLYIKNTTRILAQSSGLSGILEIGAWNRSIEQATLRLPGNATLVTDLKPVAPDAENVTIRLDLATGAAELWGGHLHGVPPMPILAPALNTGAVTLSDVKLTVGNVLLSAVNGRLSANLEKVEGTAATASLSRPTGTATLTAPLLRWLRADAAVDQTTDQFALADLSLSKIDFLNAIGEIRSSREKVALSGPVKVHLDSLTPTSLTGHATWTRPSMPAFRFLLPEGAIDALDLDGLGDLDHLRLRGRLAATQFRIGPIGIAHALSVPFDVVATTAELRFPLQFTLGPVGAGLVVHDQDQTAAITATLANADLAGQIILAWPALDQSRLEVPPDHLHLTLKNTVVTKPILAGTAPSFGSSDVRAANATALSAGEHSSGLLRLTANVLFLGQPILRVGQKGKEAPSSLTLSSTGQATARFDLATGKMALLKANFLAKDIAFSLLDPTAALDLSGTVVTSPALRLASLAIAIDQEASPPIAQAELTTLAVDASRVSRPRTNDQPNEISFAATPSQPLTIASLKATRTSIADAVDLQEVTVKGLDLEAHDASAQFGGGFAISGATLVLKAAAIADVLDAGGQTYDFDHVAFAARGSLSTTGQLHINGDTTFEIALEVSGKSNELTGTGSAKLGRFTGSMVTTLPIEVACKLNLPFEYNFASGVSALQVTALQVTADHGRFSGEGNLAPIALLLHSTSGASCNTSPPYEIVISEERKVSMTGVCCCPPSFCEWSATIPKVALRWHKNFQVFTLDGTAMLTNPRVSLRDQRLHVCNLGAISVAAPPGGALVLGVVAPQIDTGVPGADQIINPLISGAFAVVESTAATALANGAGIIASALSTPLGNLQCIAD